MRVEGSGFRVEGLEGRRLRLQGLDGPACKRKGPHSIQVHLKKKRAHLGIGQARLGMVFWGTLKSWSSNSSGKCSYERPTRGTVCGTMRSMCGADAGCSAINYLSLSGGSQPAGWRRAAAAAATLASTHSHTLSLALSLTLAHTLAHSLKHSPTHSQALSHTLSHETTSGW